MSRWASSARRTRSRFPRRQIVNPGAEWDAVHRHHVFANPNPVSAAASGVSQSGNMNFLKRLQLRKSEHHYELYDEVSVLYYAAVRYYENLGNVPEWTNSASTAELDAFPAVPTWTHPIAYSCQKNFILGIGDDHTWYDTNVGGAAVSDGLPVPPLVAADTFNQAAAWTTDLKQLEGMALNP